MTQEYVPLELISQTESSDNMADQSSNVDARYGSMANLVDRPNIETDQTMKLNGCFEISG
ncbi:MAG: hypothetical protein R2684_02195 [Pyrinomonadaceae bacterium]